MKNIAKNTLTYTGIVTLSQYIESKKVKVAQFHNAGGNALFDFLADCLMGDFNTANIKLPKKIRLLTRTTQQNVANYSYTPNSGFISINNYPEKIEYNSQSRVRFSFLIPRDQVEIINNTTNQGIGLYARYADEYDAANFVAFCALDLELNTLANNTLVVDWDLVIANKPSADI